MSEKNSFQSPNTSLEISGGFGNQLFQLAAAEYLRSQGLRVYLDFSINQRNGVRDNLIGNIAIKLNFPIYELNGLQLFFRKIPVLRRALIMSKRVHLIKEDAEFLEPPVIITDKKIVYRGYWQNSKSAAHIKDLISNHFQINKYDFIPRIALHVRRGDYLINGNPNFHGVLSGEYYADAVRSVRDEIGNLPVVIFTDSPELVAREKWVTDLTDHTFADSQNVLEDFTGIANSRAIVCSNSTFSWWAAFTSKSETVVLPSKWQVGLSIPEGLKQENSKIVKASFVGQD